MAMSTEPSIALRTRSNCGPRSMNIQRYSFVQQSENVLASRTRRAVRSHAMRAVRRQQRQESAQNIRLKWPEDHSSSKDPQLQMPDQQPSGPKEDKMLQREEDFENWSQQRGIVSGTPTSQLLEPVRRLGEWGALSVDVQNSTDPPSEGSTSLYPLRRQDSPLYATAGTDEEIGPTITYARIRLSAGRVDPFQTFSVRPHRSLAELIDHYVTIMPAAFYGIRCRKPIHIDLYRIAITQRASIHAIAAYASKNLDFLHFSEASQLTLSHTMKAVQAVNEGLFSTCQHQNDRDDGIILSIALLAFAELRFGRKEIAQQHWTGLREVIRYKGGFGPIQCNHSLKAVLAWNSTVWGASRNKKHLGSPDLPSLVSPETLIDLRHACQDFIEFFDKLKDSAYSHSVYSDPTDSTHTAYPYRNSQRAQKQSLFAPADPLYRLLNSDPNNSIGLAGQRAFEACQMPCLLYINMVMLEYASGPCLIDDFFAKLINAVFEDDLDTCVSPEHLYIRLLVGIDGTKTVRDARLCRIAKLAYVAKRLTKNLMQEARSALWKNLVLSDGLCRKDRLFTWDPTVMEAEIMKD